MEAYKINNTWIVKVLPGEPVMASLLAFAKEKKIPFGKVSGIGQAIDVKTGHYDGKTYGWKTHVKGVEVTSLIGNLCWDKEKPSEPIAHLHITFNDENSLVMGGHLSEGIATNIFEVFIEVIGKNKIYKAKQESSLKTMELPKSEETLGDLGIKVI